MKLRLAAVFIGLMLIAAAAGAAPATASTATGAGGSTLDVSKLKLSSASALVYDAQSDAAIYAKGADNVTPIASVTKLMTAMVVLDAGQSLDETISVGIDDLDLLKGSH